MLLIFGKDTCPYTNAARAHYLSRSTEFQFINVKNDPAELERMLAYSGGKTEIPVIVDGDTVTIGFGGT